MPFGGHWTQKDARTLKQRDHDERHGRKSIPEAVDKYEVSGLVQDGAVRYGFARVGEVYNGEIRGGMRHGHGKCKFPDGSVYDGQCAQWRKNL